MDAWLSCRCYVRRGLGFDGGTDDQATVGILAPFLYCCCHIMLTHSAMGLSMGEAEGHEAVEQLFQEGSH